MHTVDAVLGHDASIDPRVAGLSRPCDEYDRSPRPSVALATLSAELPLRCALGSFPRAAIEPRVEPTAEWVVELVVGRTGCQSEGGDPPSKGCC